MPNPTNTPLLRQASEVPDLLTPDSPSGLRVVRITSDPEHAHSHIYMESPVFTPDSKRFVFQRVQAVPPDENMQKRWRQYWLCDLDDGFSLRQLTDEPTAIAPAVSRDGRYLYYFISELDPHPRRGIELRRVDLDTFERETVMVLDQPLSGTSAPPCRVYSLSTIRSDGAAICTGALISDGHAPGEWAVLVCDIAKGSAEIVLAGPNYFNPHPQYPYTSDPEHLHDLLIQKNTGADTDPMGNLSNRRSGCTVEVIRDDGSHFRKIPYGSATEMCHGHQEWRGAMPSALIGVNRTVSDGTVTRPVIEALPVPAAPDDDTPPALLPDAEQNRNDITRDLEGVAFGHTAIDPTGTKFIGDWRGVGEPPEATRLFIGTLPDAPNAALSVRYLLHPRSSYTSDQVVHPHPFLSPDGTRAFFNSDYGGLPQIWMVEGFAR